MAVTVQDVENLQLAILRKSIGAEATAVAAEINSNGLTVTQYKDQLLQRADTSTDPALLMYNFVLGVTPTSQHLDDLAAFAQDQYNYYAQVLHVADPTIGPYEALGRALSSTAGFAALDPAGTSDAQFITNMYIKAFGSNPGTPQVQHFLDQVSYFQGLYTSAGIDATSAHQQALGAVMGQIVGIAAETDGSPLDVAADAFLTAAAAGTAAYGQPIEATPGVPNGAPPPPTPLNLAFTAGVDNLVGGAGDDTFTGNESTVQSGDQANGGTGFDKANLFLGPSTLVQLGQVYKVGLTDIEQVNVTPGNAINSLGLPLLISANNWTGVEEYWLRDSNLSLPTGVLTSDIHENMLLGFQDFNGNVQDNYHINTIGSDQTLTVNLQDQSHVALTTNTQGDDSFTGLDLTVVGGNNAVDFNLQHNGINHDEQLTSFVLHGTGAIDINNHGEFDTLTSLDASDNSGGFSLTIHQAGPTPVNLTAVGSTGDDDLQFTGKSFDANDSFNGLDGNDMLEVNANQAQFATSANVSNVEHFLLHGELTSNTQLFNSAGFEDIQLGTVGSNDDTVNGHALQLNGFDHVIIGTDDGSGVLQVNDANPETISFLNDADFNGTNASVLDVSGAANVTINGADGDGGVVINDLKIDGTFSQTTSLSFDGGAFFEIQDVTGNLSAPGELVDLSHLTGGFDNSGANFGSADFLVGDLHFNSTIELGGPLNANDNVVFGSALHANVAIEDMVVTGPIRDVIDVGNLGVNSLAEISVSTSGGNTFISANAGQFNGHSIEIVGQSLNLAQVAGILDFDGHVG